MKRKSSYSVAACFLTATASSLAHAAGGSLIESGLPVLQIVALILGGLLILFLKRRYQRIRTSEAVFIFVLYALLISLFTSSVVAWIKRMVG